jgi:hypothetical protein
MCGSLRRFSKNIIFQVRVITISTGSFSRIGCSTGRGAGSSMGPDSGSGSPGGRISNQRSPCPRVEISTGAELSFMGTGICTDIHNCFFIFRERQCRCFMSFLSSRWCLGSSVELLLRLHPRRPGQPRCWYRRRRAEAARHPRLCHPRSAASPPAPCRCCWLVCRAPA